MMMKGAILVAMTLGLGAPPPLESVYLAARKYDKATFHFEPPAAERAGSARALARELTAAALGGGEAPTESQRAEALRLGLELVSARDAAGPLWVLREAGARRAGDGLFAWRPHGAALCVQAPHTFFDEGTGDIALAVFAQTRAVALFVNTVHRYAGVGVGASEHAADLAHAERSIFQSATEGLLAARAMAIVQLHGFGPRDGLPADTSAVVADGAAYRAPDAPAARLRADLQGSLPGRVLLYGVDARELGATTNAQGKLARRVGAPFLHVEMSRALRASKPGPASILSHALGHALSLTP
jgi:hypothetical protein